MSTDSQRLENCLCSNVWAKERLAKKLGLEVDMRAIEFFADQAVLRIEELERQLMAKGDAVKDLRLIALRLAGVLAIKYDLNLEVAGILPPQSDHGQPRPPAAA